MTVEQIVKLIDAGYTKADIEAMTEPKNEPAAEPAPDPKPEPKAEPKPEQNDTMAAMLKEMQDLKKAVYGINIMKSEQPEKKSVDDILSEAMKGGIR